MSLRMPAKKLASLRRKFSSPKPRLKLFKLLYRNMPIIPKNPSDILSFNAIVSEGVALAKKDKKNHAYVPSRIPRGRRVSKLYKISLDKLDRSINFR